MLRNVVHKGESSEISVELLTSYFKFAEANIDQRFLVVEGSTMEYVASLMGKPGRATKIRICSLGTGIPVESCVEILKTTTCPVEIILDKDDGPEFLKNLPQDILQRVRCWRCNSKNDVRHAFILFDPFSLLHHYEGKIWRGNFCEPAGVQSLQERFSQLVRGSVRVYI